MEDAMVTDLQASDHGRASRLIPLWIALVNGLSPLIISLLIMLPLWLGSRSEPPLRGTGMAWRVAALFSGGGGARMRR